MVEMQNTSMKNAFHRCSPWYTIFVGLQRMRETGNFQARKADCCAPQKHRTLNFEENVLQHIDEKLSTSTRAIAHALDVPHTSIWHVLHKQQLHTTFRKFMYWARPILHHVQFSVHGFYTSVSTIPNFLAVFFSQMRLSWLGRLFWTVETATFGMTQILMPHSHVHFRNDSVSVYGLVSLMVIWLGHMFFRTA